jgi:hypothetical protein
MESCKTLRISIDDHFREVTKMITLAKGAQRRVDDRGIGRIRSKGDYALFGGLSTDQMKRRLGIITSEKDKNYVEK